MTFLCTTFISRPSKDLLGSFGVFFFSPLTVVWLCLTFFFCQSPPHRILVTLAIIAVLICGTAAAHRGDGYDGGLISVF